MTIAVFPGTFDPITLGHLDITIRAKGLFDHVILGIAKNSLKEPLLDLETRHGLATAATAHLPGVAVAVVDGLLVDFCKEAGATTIIKGLRGGADYDIERPMALMNRALTGIETVFISGDPSLQHIASSLVRDVARNGGSISGLVPPGVEPVVVEALAKETDR
ncbi:MAG: pantetheine-phosphate adenylyltransferase [Demequinaceae bacterium]|nr:pantetheine-phosphate adenylyltransferase [Demequinaceae bacterium]